MVSETTQVAAVHPRQNLLTCYDQLDLQFILLNHLSNMQYTDKTVLIEPIIVQKLFNGKNASHYRLCPCLMKERRKPWHIN